jgi:hypothetical protein
MLDVAAPVVVRHFRRGPGTWATVAPAVGRRWLRWSCYARLAEGLCFLVEVLDQGVGVVLVELNVVELRYQAVLEVPNEGVPITEVAARFGVTRQSVHRWLKRYAAQGLAGLVDGSTSWTPLVA